MDFLLRFGNATRFLCCTLKSTPSPHFIGVVAALRFGRRFWRGDGQIAVPRFLELATIVTLRSLAADPHAVRNYPEPLKALGKLVLGNGLGGLSVLSPRSALHSGQDFTNFLRRQPVGV